MPGAARADRADLHSVRRVAGAGAAGLGHAPQLGQRQPQRVEELDHLARRGRGPDVQRHQLIEPERRTDLGPHQAVRLRVLLRQLGGDVLPRLLGSHLAQPHVDGPLGGLLALRILLRLHPRLERGLQLLPDARHGEEPGGTHLRQVADHLARVGAAGHGEAEHERQVVAAVALGDVRHRQVRDHAPVVGEGDQLVERAHRLHQVVVRQLHALRRPGGAGGVDQREHVVLLHGAPGRLEVEVVVSHLQDLVERQHAVRGVAVHHDHVLQRAARLLHGQDAVEERLLGDDDRARRVAHEELDLLGRVGVVDGEGRGADVHRRGVGEVELGPVGEHHAERVAALQAEGHEALAQGPHLARVVRPAVLRAAVLGPQGDPVRVRRRGHLERLAERVGG